MARKVIELACGVSGDVQELCAAFYFVNDADGTECDFVVERRDGSFSAVQVCWELSHDNEEREITGAVHAMERFGLKEAVMVTQNQSDLIREGGRMIRVVPAWKWLCESGCFGRDVK